MPPEILAHRLIELDSNELIELLKNLDPEAYGAILDKLEEL
jgi:hypothetical protein